MRTLYILTFATLTLLASGYQAMAQSTDNSIVFSGFVVEEDSASDNGLPIYGVHVLIKQAHRGTITNEDGMFRLRVYPGDTVVFSAIGREKFERVIPDSARRSYHEIIVLNMNTTLLEAVQVFPFPTLEDFKQAILTAELPQTDAEKLEKTLNQELIAEMARSSEMDAGANYRWAMNQQVGTLSNRYFAPSFSFMNPFAWGRFIKSLKKDDKKK